MASMLCHLNRTPYPRLAEYSHLTLPLTINQGLIQSLKGHIYPSVFDVIQDLLVIQSYENPLHVNKLLQIVRLHLYDLDEHEKAPK